LIGCPPFSGFFSKDAILALAYQRNTPIFLIGLTTAFLTAFYVSRAVVVVFLGKPRSEVARAGKESPLVMIIPLLVLALFALTIPAANWLIGHVGTHARGGLVTARLRRRLKRSTSL